MENCSKESDFVMDKNGKLSARIISIDDLGIDSPGEWEITAVKVEPKYKWIMFDDDSRVAIRCPHCQGVFLYNQVMLPPSCAICGSAMSGSISWNEVIEKAGLKE